VENKTEVQPSAALRIRQAVERSRKAAEQAAQEQNAGSSEAAPPEARPTEPASPGLKMKATEAAPAAPAAASKAAEPESRPTLPLRRPAEEPAKGESSAKAGVRISPPKEKAPDKVEKVAKKAAEPAAGEPKPAPAVEPAPAADSAPTPFSGLEPPSAKSWWARVPVVAKAAAVVVIVASAGFAVFTPVGAKKTTARPAVSKGALFKVGSALSMAQSGWAPDWGGDANRKLGRIISLFRPSQLVADYRVEFEGQIERKALGWVVRAQDPSNYYLYKLEVLKPGLQQQVALSRVAVIDGDQGQVNYSLLPKSQRPDTIYRVRLDVRGDEFTTYINGELIDAFQDQRIKKGGVGLAKDKDELSQVRKFQVYESAN
jgi:hypothetical protein